MLAWICPTCNDSFNEETVTRHLEENHVGVISNAYECGDCGYQAARFDQIGAHCLKLKHDPENVERGEQYEVQNRRLLSALKVIVDKIKGFDDEDEEEEEEEEEEDDNVNNNDYYTTPQQQVNKQKQQYQKPPSSTGRGRPRGRPPKSSTRQQQSKQYINKTWSSGRNLQGESGTGRKRQLSGRSDEAEEEDAGNVVNNGDSGNFLCMTCGDYYSTRQKLLNHLKIHQSPPPRPTIPTSLLSTPMSAAANNNGQRIKLGTGNRTPLSSYNLTTSVNYDTPPFSNRSPMKTRGGDRRNPKKLWPRDSFSPSESPEKHRSNEKNKKTKPPHKKKAVSDSSVDPDLVCRYCKKVFSHKSSVSRHEPIHTGERPYKCRESGCGRGFIQAVNLRDHMVLGHGEPYPYHCSQCQKGFLRQPDCLRHEENKCPKNRE